MNVLISLHRGYGLGDAVQMSSVLRHVKRYRPNWTIDFQAEAGRFCVGNGIVANTFEYGKNPNPNKHYDAEVQILLYDTFHNFTDRPNTRVSSCLREWFDIPWDSECGRYQINVSDKSIGSVRTLLGANCERTVDVHYLGDSSQDKKNLSHKQADEICQYIDQLGYVPVILDWRRRSCGLDYRRITSPEDWGGDAEMVTALISQCEAFVGIDSGPAKCASATNIPSLVVWTGHHPALFHDPAPNTTHLVPVGYHCIEPVNFNRGVMDWFEKNYSVRYYTGDPISEVRQWLRDVLA